MQTYEIRLMAQKDWIAETHIFATDSLASAVARAKTLLARNSGMESAQVRSRGGLLLVDIGQPQDRRSAA